MSTWGTLEAQFAASDDLITEDLVMQNVPTGSETGPSCHLIKGTLYVRGRLRDVDDLDSPEVLAWFLSICQWNPETASLVWDVDDGPRYRYEWRDGGLRKLRGVLDG